MLDCDTVAALRRLVQDTEVGAAEALVDDLIEVGIGGHFLARRSTRERSRAGELWRPRVWQRQTFDQYEGTSLVADAAAVGGGDCSPRTRCRRSPTTSCARSTP